MPKTEVAAFLAEKKAKAFLADDAYQNKIILTADTTVLIDGILLEKPQNDQEAFAMLSKLSGRTHQVISGFSILHKGTISSYSDETLVTFSQLSDGDIKSYIKEHQPYDKAGAYGIQEGIGLTHITRLEGSYFTVMGLPIHLVHDKLAQLK